MATVRDQAALRLNEEDEEPISNMTTICESNFSESLKAIESKGEKKYAEILRKLQSKFVDWAAYLGVFAGGSASLDQRLKHHPQYCDLVLLALDMLIINLMKGKTEILTFHHYQLTEEQLRPTPMTQGRMNPHKTTRIDEKSNSRGFRNQ